MNANDVGNYFGRYLVRLREVRDYELRAPPPRARALRQIRVHACLCSGQEFQSSCETWTYAERAEVSAVRREESVDVAPFGNRSHGAVDKTQIEVFESGVKLESANDVGRKWKLVLVTRRGVEDLGGQFSHRGSVVAEKVVYLRQNESGDDDDARGGENGLVIRKAWFAVSRMGESAEEPTRVRDDRRAHGSRSRKSSDSSPNLLSVDSNRRVEGGRRPV